MQKLTPDNHSSNKQLDLLLMREIRVRKVQPDGIRFQRLRYLSPTLAAYVGEVVTIRYDPRDLGEVRVFYEDRFLCRAIAADLAGEFVALKDIVRARNRRRKELRSIIEDRQQAVDTLFEIKRGTVLKETPAKPSVGNKLTEPALKRYRNE